MKFDAAIHPNSLKLVPGLAQQIESFGFDGLWTTETAHNPFLPITLAAANTGRISLGTAIAIAFARSPMVTAQLAWDLPNNPTDASFLASALKSRPMSPNASAAPGIVLALVSANIFWHSTPSGTHSSAMNRSIFAANITHLP